MKKSVLITGCSSGFGYGMALKFSENGYTVFASVRDWESNGARELRRKAEEGALSLTVLEIDVRDGRMIKKGIRAIQKKVGRIDILINNAGYGYLGPVEETPIKDIQELHDINVLGVIRMTQAVVPLMRNEHAGLIINFSSINGLVPFPLFSIYSMTKFAIETLSEGLRFELKHFSINVVMIEPGSYLTRFSENRKETKHSDSSPYKQLLDHFSSRYKKTHDLEKKHIVLKTADPQEVIDKVFSIAQLSHPKARYRIGNDAQKYYYIRRLLPFPVWEWILHKVYKW